MSTPRIPNLVNFCTPTRGNFEYDGEDEHGGLLKGRSVFVDDSFTATSESPRRLSFSSNNDIRPVTPEPGIRLEKAFDQSVGSDKFELEEEEGSSTFSEQGFVLLFVLLILRLILWKSSVECEQVSSELREFPSPAMLVASKEFASEYDSKATFEFNPFLNVSEIPCNDTFSFYRLKPDASGPILMRCTFSVNLDKAENNSLSCTS
eukprot:scaffold1537_cov108-Cylindrotheca_fusiformis.AAC.3